MMTEAPAPQGPRLSLVPKGDDGPPHADDHYRFTLYVAGDTPKSLAAIANLRRLCDVHLGERATIEVIDLTKEPELAARDQIVALPTLVRRLPPPIKRLIGSLADTERVMVGLELGRDAT
jgi:circadian clock protein KaiB